MAIPLLVACCQEGRAEGRRQGQEPAEGHQEHQDFCPPCRWKALMSKLGRP